MPGHPSPDESLPARDADEQEQPALRALNRSPHPYHRQSSQLQHQDHSSLHHHHHHQQRPGRRSARALPSPVVVSSSKESAPGSDSGTDADDEHFLRGLPAPKPRPHKGIRGLNEALSGTTTPVLSTGLGEEELGIPPQARQVQQQHAHALRSRRRLLETVRRKRVLLRRTAEVALLVALAAMIAANRQVHPVLHLWRRDFRYLGFMYMALLALYPLRLLRWASSCNRQPSSRFPFKIPASFDPAPLLYPSAIPIFVSLLVSANHPSAVMPNVILAVGAIPQLLVPKLDLDASYDTLHWLLSCLPLVWRTPPEAPPSPSLDSDPLTALPATELLVLLYPLQRTLCLVLQHLTTTSLLTTELQLLSTSLLNLALLASSPQAQILKALLWYGGLSILVLCGAVIQWGIALARVPRWRFRRDPHSPRRPLWKSIARFLWWKRIKTEMLGAPPEHSDASERMSTSAEDDELSLLFAPPTKASPSPPGPLADAAAPGADGDHLKNDHHHHHHHQLPPEAGLKSTGVSLRCPAQQRSPRKPAATHTPSGKRKRTTSISLRAYFKLTYGQATVRKWAYAAYVYLCLLLVVAAVVRTYIQRHALGGREPLGWALGYLLGDLPWFRLRVVSANLERWIVLPERFGAHVDDHDHDHDDKQCHLGWVQHIRHADLGEANTRLVIGGYWLAILVVGLAVVFRLKDTYEVDTRRKVFHFIMVAMLLPATFVDPAFAALALSAALSVFLVLDLLRASQLPPLSKPIAAFLAPFVDGRDFRGPVVISHIFLLVGCAIPLWLSLASLPRTASSSSSSSSSSSAGWELPTRDVSMVSGVVCVGLGDAAASLVGRRFGHRKWVWGGGKSLEGSVAFAAAVFVGLSAASAWLRVGRWPTTAPLPGAAASATHALACAGMASLTEAVLTGGNDNVIVPVVLWTCVKALEI